MKKLGRPSLTKKKRKSQRLQIRITSDEYKKISKKAKEIDKQVSDWARKALLDLTDL